MSAFQLKMASRIDLKHQNTDNNQDETKRPRKGIATFNKSVKSSDLGNLCSNPTQPETSKNYLKTLKDKR